MPVPLGGLGAKILDRGNPGGAPKVQVLLDDGTGTFPFDITKYVLLANGLAFNRGRQDWQGGVTAGDLSLTLNNSDGRFTVGSTILGTPSPIKVDQRIRVKVTVNGTTFTRFTGYVKQWPVSWPATVTSYAEVRLVATDAQARASRWVLRSVPEQELLEDAPAAYWTMGDAAGSTAASESSGNLVPALTAAGPGTAVVFGNAIGPGTDGLTAAKFANGQWLQGSGPAATIAATMCAFSTTVAPASGTSLLVSLTPGVDLISINTAGKLLGPSGLVSPNAVTDGATHVAEVRYSGTTVFLVLDGVAVASTASALSGVTITQVQIGQLYTGVIAHVALFAADPGATRATAHATAMLTGFAGEASTTRINRLAGYANLPVGTLDTTLTNVVFTDVTGRNAWDALQDVADTEMGVVFIDGSGNLTFHSRNRPASKTQPDLTLIKDAIASDVQPVHDDQQIINYLEATAAGTQVTQFVRNAASESVHGQYSPGGVSYLVLTNAEALDRANWIVVNFAEPSTRYGTLTINMFALSPDAQATVLTALEINSWLRVVQMPAQNTGGATVDVVVEGYAEAVGANSWTLTLNVVSKSLSDCLILDDPVRGLPNGTNRLYV